MNYAIEEMKNVERLVTHTVYVMYRCIYIILIILLLVHNKAFFCLKLRFPVCPMYNVHKSL